MKKDIIKIIICPLCKNDRLNITSFKRNKYFIIDGLIKCDSCKTIFPIIDSIPHLVDPLIDDYRITSRFYKKYKIKSRYNINKESWDLVQAEFFNNYSSKYDEEMLSDNFWNIIDQDLIQILIKKTKSKFALDVGCGTGRSTEHLVKTNINSIGVDISHKMLVQAFKKNKGTSFLMADANNLPFKKATFDLVLFMGTLHHVSDPLKSLKESHRVIKINGEVKLIENNKSIFRPLFDFLMKFNKLWNDGPEREHATMNIRYMRKIIKLSRFKNNKVYTKVFILPQIINLLSKNTALNSYLITEKLFTKLPLIKNQGGLLIGECKK